VLPSSCKHYNYTLVRRKDPKWKQGLHGWARAKVKLQRHRRVRVRRQNKSRERSPGTFSAGSHRLNRALIKKKTSDKRAFHRFPKVFDLVNNYDETIRWITNLRQDIYVDPAYSVFIDHSQVQKASPEALLVLIAEMTRAHQYSTGCRKLLNWPPAGDFLDLGWALGYLQHFGYAQANPPAGTKEFLRYFTGKRTLQHIVKQLVDHFVLAWSFDIPTTKALKVAMSECMTNVNLHAYDKTSRNLIDQWWLMGFRDRQSHEISFCFYDQGQGIPGTIRIKWRDTLPGVAPSDSEMIAKGIGGHYSRTGEAARGSGLPTLAEFVDQATDGQLLIFSRKGRYCYSKDKSAVYGDVEFDLPGTLIVWTIKK
jgi:hypothetical protein